MPDYTVAIQSVVHSLVRKRAFWRCSAWCLPMYITMKSSMVPDEFEVIG
jgi:hypothetical protein